MGHMLFTLILDRLDGGGQPDISFGMKDGQFIIGHGGVSTDISDGTPTVTEMLVVLRIEYGDGASGPDDNELLTLWVDPLNESSIPVIDSLPVDILNSGGGKIIAVAIRGEHMAGQPAFFDNLRVGLKFQDVTTDVQLPVLSPDYSINGMFFDSNNPGHGLNLSAHTHGFTVFYYGHTSNGERLWLQSEVFKGDIEFGVPIELEMFEVVNGVFGQPVPPETYWGMLTINLDDCDSGYALFSGIDGNLEMDLMRLTRLPDVGCQK